MEQKIKGDYKDQFLRILNNKEKSAKSGKKRHKGFLVVVRQAQNLQMLQDLCISKDQSWNNCLTARYRQGPGPRFGTLLAAFLSDMQVLNMDGPDLKGDLQPDRQDSLWFELLKKGFFDDAWSIYEKLNFDNPAQFDNRSLDLLIKLLSSEQFFPVGKRLVLFSETDTASKDLEEWNLAMELLIGRLPERIGIVLSGVPDGIEVPQSNPHFIELELPDLKDLPSRKRAIETLTYTLPPLQSDKPADVDRLGVKEYAIAIADFVLHPNTNPLTVGIQGPWGKGKSSFMGFVEHALITQAEPNRGEPYNQYIDADQKYHKLLADRPVVTAAEEVKKKYAAKYKDAHDAKNVAWNQLVKNASEEVITASFNAWRYEDARQIWAGLASVITDRLEKQLSRFKRLKLPLKYAWKHHRKFVIWHNLIPLLFGMLITLIVWIVSADNNGNSIANSIAKMNENQGSSEVIRALQLTAKDLQVTGLAHTLQMLLPAATSALLFGFLMWRIYILIQPVSQQISQFVQMPAYRKEMGYQHQVLDDIKFVYDYISRGSQRPRVVVFIDDLDRCSDDKVMEILQAIHLILGANSFYVFLGIDTEMIYRAIESHYVKNQEGGALPNDFARKYLRKIIQLSFHLPLSGYQEHASLLSSLFSRQASEKLREKLISPGNELEVQTESIPDEGALTYNLGAILNPVIHTITDVEDSADELEAFLDFDSYLTDNAREIKRIVNVHRLVKILLQRSGAIWTKNQQRKLVKWLIFCTRWPQFVDNLFNYAKNNPEADNCILGLYDQMKNQIQGSEDLKEFSNKKDIIASRDLLERHLYLTAELTQMIQSNLEISNTISIHTASSKSINNEQRLSANFHHHLVVGNRRSRIYHLPGCPSYNRVPSNNREFFESITDAESAGYRRARNCPKQNK